MLDKKQNRDNYLDILKGIGILLVIYNHCPGPVGTPLISRFHMPLFFILSGVTFSWTINKVNAFWEFFTKMVVKLMLPYYIFGLLDLVVYLSVSHELWESKQILYYFLGMRNLEKYYFTGALWFLSALFISEICLYLLVVIIKKDVVIFSIIAAITCLIKVKLPVLALNLDALPMTLPMLYVGYAVGRFQGYQEYKDNRNNIILMMISLMILVLIYKYDGPINVYKKMSGDGLYYLIGGISGTLLIAEFGKIVLVLPVVNEVLAYIGKYSLFYMAIHQQLILHPMNVHNIFQKNTIIYFVCRFVICLLGSTVLTIFELRIIAILKNKVALK